VGVVWLKNSLLDWQNGFEVSFNMAITSPTCSGTWSGLSNCGAGGYAFVVQSAGPRVQGSSGGGLGYKGISNAFAVEFDTSNNDNDPIIPNQSHISAIATPGVADASEANSIGWNDSPVNFNNPNLQGFIANPLITIRYMGNTLTVYVNSVL